jgi:HEAT repeat protein
MLKKRRFLWVSLTLLAVLAAAPFGYYVWVRSHGGHFYRGRSTTYWSWETRRYFEHPTGWSEPFPDRCLDFLGWLLLRLGKGPGEPAVLEGDPSALPVLLDLMQEEDVGVRCWAIAAIGRVGPAAQSAFVVIRDATQDTDERIQGSAWRALVAINADEAAIFFLDRIKSRDRSLLMFLRALGKCGASARKAVPGLVDLLHDGNPQVRSRAAEALGDIGPDAGEAVPHLVVLLKDPEEQCRSSASLALARLGSVASRAIPVLIEGLHNPDPSYRHFAAISVGRIAMTAEPALKRAAALAAAQSLQDPDVKVRRACALSLCEIGDFGSEADFVVLKLIQAMQDPDAQVRQGSYAALGRFGPRAREAIPELAKVLMDEREKTAVWVQAAEALRRITGWKPPYNPPNQRASVIRSWQEWCSVSRRE